MTGRPIALALLGLALLDAHPALAQFVGERCNPASEVLIVRIGTSNEFPSAGIAEPVAAAEFTLICARPGQDTAIIVWQLPFSCGETAESAVVSWRSGGRIRINCIIPEIDDTGEEAS